MKERVEAALGARVTAMQAVAGGSINRAWRATTDAGPVFVKSHASPPPGFFAAEADGLRRIAAAGVRAPVVLAVGDDFLALEWLEPGRPRWEDAGRALATLHAATGERFGLERDNVMGAVPQSNAAASDATFATFFRERRLEPLAMRLPSRARARLDRLDLGAILTEPDRPRLVHGDLWSGNLLHAAIGPVLIDPAVHYGHPEQDLAMSRLFGGFAPAFEAAYREAAGWPARADVDFPRRLAALNLYPLLVHLHLFGDGYLPDIEATLAELV
ncbi:MAG: fructosamine kinase family protein [Myxococcota bacterium]